jgi:tetratricopeptide (TPR) repeat protein
LKSAPEFSITCFLSLLFLLSVTFLPAQTKKPAAPSSEKQQAIVKARKAEALIDSGKIDEAIPLLQECITADPASVDYPYELAYAYCTQKKDSIAYTVLEGLLDRPNTTDVIYQLAGNCQDNMFHVSQAKEIFQAGLKKFPTSGRLNMECGQLEMEIKEYNRALVYYESGIEKDPKFAANYYWAAKLFCHSSEPVWGMIYGELFVLLEPGSKRSDEISKLLYDTYKSQIKFRPDTTFTVSFSKQTSIAGDTVKGKKAKPPFGITVYEPILGIAVLKETAIDINSLDRIRKRFLENYFSSGTNKKYPNLLFDYQDEVLKAGQMEAYNHWLLMEGDKEGFKKWHAQNKAKWVSFGNWFKDHPLKTDQLHRFYRGQYEQ